MVKNPPAMLVTWVRLLGPEDPLEKGLATLFSIPVWRMPWTEEPGRLQSLGSQRVGLTEQLFHFMVDTGHHTCVQTHRMHDTERALL